MGQLVRLFQEPSPSNSRKTEMPARLSIKEIRRLFRLAAKHGYTIEQVEWACLVVRNWATTNQRKRADWVCVINNALMMGWGRAGFPDFAKRRNLCGMGTRITARTVEDRIAKLIEHGYR